MEPIVRKLVTIITESIIEADLIRDLEGLGIHGYTITDARGRGSRGTRSAQWEHGASIRIEVICDAGVAAAIAGHLQQHYYERFAMVSFTTDVQVLREHKF